MESLSETELHAPLRLLILVRWSDLLFSFPRFRHLFSSPFLFIREKRKSKLKLRLECEATKSITPT